MQKYAWTAVAPDGQTRKGTVEAADARSVAEWLTRDGHTVISVSKVKWPPTNLHVETVTRRDLIHLTYKFLPLVGSSLGLDRALEILRGEVKKRRIRNALVSIKQDMHGGSAMSQAMARHPAIFNTPYVSAVRAGEESGNMPKSLSMIGSYLEWLDRTVRQVWSAIAYPIAVLLAMAVLCCVLAFWVMPEFIHLYDRLGHKFEMPWMTKIVFDGSHLLRTYWYVPMIIIVALIVLYVMRKRLPGFRLWLHKLVLHLPIVGMMVRQLQALQFCRFFHLLHSNGVQTKHALAEARGTMTNIPMNREVQQVSRRLDEGMSLGEAFHYSRYFPSLVAEQIRVGEEAGNLNQSMEYVIRYYDLELEYSVRRFTGILGRVLVVLLAILILGLALSFYLPLFHIADMIQPQNTPGLQ